MKPRSWLTIPSAAAILTAVTISAFAAQDTAAQADAAFPATVRKVTITPAEPDSGDIRRMGAGRQGVNAAAKDAPVYIVKVYFSGQVPVDADGFDIQVGDQPVGGYGPFRNGVFFKIYDKDAGRKLAGKEISIIRRGKTILTGRMFPDISVADEEPQAEATASGKVRHRPLKEILAY